MRGLAGTAGIVVVMPPTLPAPLHRVVRSAATWRALPAE